MGTAQSRVTAEHRNRVGGPRSGGTGTRLASADGGQDQSANGKLRSSKATWSKVGSDTGALAGNVHKSLTTLAEKQTGSIGGVRTAAAQRKVYQSWKRYLEDVGKRCRALEAGMQKVGSDGKKTDDDIGAAFAAMEKDYADTDALGGTWKGG